MDMGSHGDSASGGAACKISMLWNWYTVDSCFLSATWHNHSKVAFAFTVIGVFFIVAGIEGVRRLHRDYDRRIIAKYLAISQSASSSVEALNKSGATNASGNLVVFRPSWTEHAVRAVFYGIQFTAAFLVMLMGMYYNGYVLFAIFLGGTAGYAVFARDTLQQQVDLGSGCCC